jgi:hypothetical protein
MLMMESLKMEKSHKSWGLHVSGDGSSYMLDRYYAKGSQMAGVQPMDRLIACWAHCILAKACVGLGREFLSWDGGGTSLGLDNKVIMLIGVITLSCLF